MDNNLNDQITENSEGEEKVHLLTPIPMQDIQKQSRRQRMTIACQKRQRTII